MNHSFTIFSTKNEIDNLQIEFKDQRFDAVNILSKKVNLNFPSSILVSYEKTSLNSIKVNVTSFLNIRSECKELSLKITEKNKNLKVFYRAFNKNENTAEGYEFYSGRLISEYIFEGKEVLCDIITDYMCAAHIALDKHEEVHIDGVLLSVFSGTSFEVSDGLEYSINNHRIFFKNNQSLYLHMEYNNVPVIKLNEKLDSYRTYGLSNATWTKNGSIEEEKTELSEILSDDVVDNFEEIVPYKFALECYENSKPY